MSNSEKDKYAVSVVVPAYNMGQYLSECVESLIEQTLKSIEIIIVDDGSTDDSSVIADAFASSHANVKVIHQRNQGLGPARNSGIDIASGEYVGFVDSDDWVESDMFEKLYDLSAQVDADICYSGISYRYKNGVINNIVHPLAGAVIDEDVELKRFHYAMYGYRQNDTLPRGIPISCWNAIYRREFLVKNQICFKNIRSEDRDFNVQCTRLAKCIVFDKNCFYCYRKEGQASITSTFKEKSILDCMQLHDVLMLEVDEENREDKEECFTRLMGTSIDLFLDLFRASILLVPEKTEQKRLLRILMKEAEERNLLDKAFFNSKGSQKRITYDLIERFGPYIAKIPIIIEKDIHKTLSFAADVTGIHIG